MADIVTQSAALKESYADRVNSRHLARIGRAATLVATEHKARLDVVTEVTESALLATAEVSALEAHLVGMVPHAEGRLKFVADAGSAALANVVTKMARS